MANSSMFVKIHPTVLLEWLYDSENLNSDNYQVVQNLSTDRRGYMSQLGLNRIDNTIFPVDPVIKKYAKINTSKYNYLKIETYSTSLAQFDKLRIHLPSTYSFADNGYIGLHMRIYTYDHDNKKQIDFSSFLYDDSQIGEDANIVLNEEFFFDEQSWGKYLTYNIPSIDYVSKQRTSTVNTNLPTTNSINANLVKNNGISETSPIFIEFAFVVSREEILGNTYYYLSDYYKKSIPKTPEYVDLKVNIEQSTDGDYFEIYGSYANSNELLDDFIDELRSKGLSVKLEYEISLYEESTLMYQENRVVTDNFSKKIWYRPIISFSNTTASIDVTMKVIDLVNDSEITRFASISLRNEIFKYGKKLTRINIDNAYKPKIYNLKSSNSIVEPTSQQLSDVTLTKVNFPVISDRINILVSSAPSNSTKYKSMGLAEIIINPFGNTVKFNIASSVNNNGVVTPYDLTKITENAEIVLNFKSDTDFLEKMMWQETDQNDFKNGVIIFRIDQQDLTTLKKIGENNKNFYLNIKSNKTGIRSLLYSGKWVNFTDMTFVDTTNNDTAGVDFGDFADLGLSLNELQNIVDSNLGSTNVLSNNTNTNVIIFLNPDANVSKFESYLNTLNVNIYLKKPAGNSTCLTYFYFILNVSPSVAEDMKVQPGVSELIPIGFNLGLNTTGTNSVSLNNIKDRVTNFNCSK